MRTSKHTTRDDLQVDMVDTHCVSASATLVYMIPMRIWPLLYHRVSTIPNRKSGERHTRSICMAPGL